MVEQIMRSSNPHKVATDSLSSLLLNIRLPSQVFVDPRDSRNATSSERRIVDS